MHFKYVLSPSKAPYLINTEQKKSKRPIIEVAELNGNQLVENTLCGYVGII